MKILKSLNFFNIKNSSEIYIHFQDTTTIAIQACTQLSSETISRQIKKAAINAVVCGPSVQPFARRSSILAILITNLFITPGGNSTVINIKIIYQ